MPGKPSMPKKLSLPYPVVIVLGPTAAGKSRFAMGLAERFPSEIISFDSIKVYRGMDVGTDKPSEEEMERFGYHLVDVRSPSETMNAGEFIRLAGKKVAEVLSRNHLPIIEGGTALYLKSFVWGIFEGPGRDEDLRKQLHERAEKEGPEALHRELAKLDPARAADILPRDLKRIIRALEIARLTGQKPSELRKEWDADRPREGYAFIMLGISRKRDELYRRIDDRIAGMMSNGLLDEVGRIWQGGGFSRTSREAIGYRQLIEYLDGKIELDEAVRRIRKATHDFARRQENWFKHFPDVEWFEVTGDDLPVQEAAARVRDALPLLCPAWRHLVREKRD
jgi:tRNA dimethylallyltransferase